MLITKAMFKAQMPTPRDTLPNQPKPPMVSQADLAVWMEGKLMISLHKFLRQRLASKHEYEIINNLFVRHRAPAQPADILQRRLDALLAANSKVQLKTR